MGDNKTTGFAAAKAKAEELKAESEEKEKQVAAVKEQVKNDLLAIQGNDVLARMYQASAEVGAENLSGELPVLKVHSAGKSNNELADGSEPTDGYFFYKPTGEEFETLDVHILYVSHGFKAAGMEEGGEAKFNQIVGGVIIDNGDYKPFIMYFTGLKLQPLWDFSKEAKKYTRAKPLGIPMFALKVHLETEKVKTNFGRSWIVKFSVARAADGTPELVLDEGLFQFLKDNVETTKEMIGNIIASKEVPETNEAEIIHGETAEVTESEGVDEIPAEEGQAVEPDEIPF